MEKLLITSNISLCHIFSSPLSTKCSWWAFVIAQCPSSVVHNFFNLLLLNHWTILDETWQGCSLDKALPKLFKRLNSTHYSGCHGNQKEKNSKIFFSETRRHRAWYLICSISYWTSTRILHMMPLVLKLAPPRGSQVWNIGTKKENFKILLLWN